MPHFYCDWPYSSIRAVTEGLRSIWQRRDPQAVRPLPRLPWIPFSAIAELDRLIKPTWMVSEIGSGMSTLWLSIRAGHVTSIEADRTWFHRALTFLTSLRVNSLRASAIVCAIMLLSACSAFAASSLPLDTAVPKSAKIPLQNLATRELRAQPLDWLHHPRHNCLHRRRWA